MNIPPEFFGRSFVYEWVKAAKDYDYYLPDRLQFENDLLKGRRAGYIYCRVFRNFVPGKREPFWKIQDINLDDVEKGAGTADAIRLAYGNDTSIFNLPFEVQLDIDNQYFFIKNEISTPDLDMNPSFSYITGDEKMLSDFINSGEVPTAKDITKDGGIF